MIDQSIGHYHISEMIGKGGMGEVYRATDTRLNREVALKILPDAFADDPVRMARFSREAQVLASLSHVNIAAIHGLEEAGGKRALVMELVDGETIADLLRRGPVPVEEALRIARQIAEALEQAHEQGIIHRDLKPANVKVTPEGTVKLLDFGLAKALEGEEADSFTSADFSESPTLTALTHAGAVLGTAAYMSPEQARSRKTDRRADIWSFGVVLYEMLTGVKAFPGETAADVLASVLRSDLDQGSMPRDLPAPVRRLVRRCLVRDPRMRLQAIGDARIVIDECLAGAHPDAEVGGTAAAAVTPPLWKRALPWVLFAAAAGLAAVLAVGTWRPAAEPSLRINVEASDQPLFLGLGSSLVFSPDGTQVAFVTAESGGTAVHIRSLERLESIRVAAGSGEDIPYNPFFSPDGQWLGYVTTEELRKVSVKGGSPVTLCRVQRSRGASWGPNNTIVFAHATDGGLYRVPAAGGEPEALTRLDASRGEFTHRWPQVLPGGKAVLYTSHTQSSGFDKAHLEVLVLETGERKVVHRGGSYGRYASSGHLVYVSRGMLYALPFDLDRLEATGSPVPAVHDVYWDVTDGGGQFSFSDTGSLVYLGGQGTAAQYPVVWVDRRGVTTPLWDERGSYGNPRISPDGRRLSLTVLLDGKKDIWDYDLERGVPTRLTFEAAVDAEQLWSPDGEHVVFSSDRNGSDNLYRTRADGSEEVERVTQSQAPQWPASWSSDGRFLAFATIGSSYDLWVLPMTGEKREPVEFLATSLSESVADFSPDGRWIAYASNDSGRFEVYVRPFPKRPGRWQVSDGGGSFPRWSRDGGEIFYRTDTGIMAAPVWASETTFQAGKPGPLFKGAFRGGLGGLGIAGYVFADYDVAPDGQRFVMFPYTPESPEGEHDHFTLVTRWFDELRRIAPGP